MAVRFCFTVRFLQRLSHGRGEGGAPEWPPSPLRLFQALIAASAARWNERLLLAYAAPALTWLEKLSPPMIVAPLGRIVDVGYRLYVPDNIGDKVASSWSRGGTGAIADYRTEKDVRPVHLSGEAVHYLYSIPDGDPDFVRHKDVLSAAARSITHLGWGIDMVVGDATVVSEEDVEKLAGERWRPVDASGGTGLRVPIDGTLAALIQKHGAFLNRLGPDGFKPVPPLSAFRVVNYRRTTEPAPASRALFSILRPDYSGMRPFDAVRKTREVAGMVRAAVGRVATAQGWSVEQRNVFIHGKTANGSSPARTENSPDRFSYLPLPTINSTLQRVEAIRRVLIAAPAHCRQQIAWVRRALAGAELTDDDGRTIGIVSNLPGSDWVSRQYLDVADTWSTVTPVIMPRHEGYRQQAAGRWIRTAFLQAGYEPELIDRAEIEWRGVGYRAGVDLASRYLPPENLANKPRYHVRARFPHPIPGPVAVGSGRFRGFGLFAVDL